MSESAVQTRGRPIPFSPQMVRAILDGRKTQTRRVIRELDECVCRAAPAFLHGSCRYCGGRGRLPPTVGRCPYGKPGDRLWICSRYHVRHDQVRNETHWTAEGLWVTTHGPPHRNDGQPMRLGDKPAMHMPYWLAVEKWPQLVVMEIRVERVKDISEADAQAEGVRGIQNTGGGVRYKDEFFRLWSELNAERGYGLDVNPWVWAVTFRVER